MFGFVLCADDFAMTDGVSRGILELAAAGRLSATGAMTNRPHWLALSRDIAAFSDSLDIGVHLNLTCAEPLTRMPHFAPGGELPRLPVLLKAGILGKLPVLEVVSEINAQLSAFEDAMGRAPDFIDGHQHVHGLPGVRGIFQAVIANRYKGSEKPYIRASGDTLARVLRRGQFAGKALKVKLLSAGASSKLLKAGFPVNDGFSGFSDFDPAASYSAQFESYLAAPGKRQLIMCHPGYADDELRRLDPVVTVRERELAFLGGAEFEALLVRQGARLSRFLAFSPVVGHK